MGAIIKTGVCSYGMSGKLFHAPFIQNHPGYELTGIVERHNNDSRERYPRSKLYRSVDELIADDSIQLIIVNTPTHLHYENAKAALTAGKNIVVEKPFAVTVKDAEEITALAREKNLFISIYQNRRYDGDYHAIKDVLGKKTTGRVERSGDKVRPLSSYSRLAKLTKKVTFRVQELFMTSALILLTRLYNYLDGHRQYLVMFGECVRV